VAPDLAVGNGLQPEWLSARCRRWCSAYREDPLVHDRVSATLVRFMVDERRVRAASAAAWRVPTLLLWAGADRCVAPAGSQAFLDAAPRSAVQGECLSALAHEILNEPERDQVLQRMQAWLETRR
jgi:alpha-beta hydrolase superfamily lysophospholipase